MLRKLFLLISFYFCCNVISLAESEQKNAQINNEMQVLIDVSGSMKKNDPNNLRIPAVRLLINLLPEDTRVGIWLFAEQAVELVKAGQADRQWKNNALAQLDKIHSAGLLTDIEAAITSATAPWINQGDEQSSRHLVLLTDGMVDVSKDFMQSAESRNRILDEQLPLLLKAGVQVQSIALSENADAALMQKLAFDTLGWSETVLSAEQLQKVFFKLFKQAIPQDSVPIKGNSFAIDASIKEFSVLVFKQSGAAQSRLVQPDKKSITAQTKLEHIAWLAEKNYDLVTVKQPLAGVWKIDAEMDPENQVMIVTDLKLELDPLPRYLPLNEALEISAFFTDKQQLISRDDFLSLIDISVQSAHQNWRLSAVPEQAGLFSLLIKQGLPAGRHQLSIVADGKTFKRQINQSIEVIESPVTVTKTVDQVKRTVKIQLQLNEALINPENIGIEASISQPGVKTQKLSLQKTQGKWLMTVTAAKPGERKIINFMVMAQTVEGLPVSPVVPAVTIDDSLFENKVVEKKQIEAQEQQKDEPQDSQPEPQVDETEEQEKQTIDWLKSSILVLVVNLILMTAGYFIYKFIKKNEMEKQQQLLSKLD